MTYVYIYAQYILLYGNMGIIQVPTPYLQRERDRVRERQSENLVVSVLHVFFLFAVRLRINMRYDGDMQCMSVAQKAEELARIAQS